MPLIEIDKGDTIATKDGRELEVLSIYKPDGTVIRVDCIDRRDPSPMRLPVFSKEIARVIKKTRPVVPPSPPAPLPPEQKVVAKEPLSEALKKDIAEREKSPTASAQHRKHHEKGAK